jgi:hypothetical protein
LWVAGDQPPFGTARAASSLEPISAAVVFGLREHLLGDRLSLAVELLAVICL